MVTFSGLFIPLQRFCTRILLPFQKKLKDPEVLNPHISGGINADFAGTTKPVGNGMYVATTSTANVTKLVVTVTAWIQLSIVSTLFPMFVINQPRLHLCAIPAIITEIVL